MKYNPLAGSSIEAVISIAIDLAKMKKEEVQFNFNGVSITVNSGSRYLHTFKKFEDKKALLAIREWDQYDPKWEACEVRGQGIMGMSRRELIENLYEAMGYLRDGQPETCSIEEEAS